MTDTPFERRHNTCRDRKILARTFPACFVMPKTAAQKKPLRIGIEYAIERAGVVDDKGHEFTMVRIKLAVADYCAGRRYQEGIIREDVRIDLDGSPTGEVTAEHEAHARDRLLAMDAKRDAALNRVYDQRPVRDEVAA